ncbi:MAG: hypothetical protein STHCBS139747_000071 [Sporothrix thermara]
MVGKQLTHAPAADTTFAELDPAVLQDTMLMAFDVDQWLNFDALWPHADGLMVTT